MNLEFSRVPKNIQVSNIMKIRAVGAELSYVDGRTDGHEDDNSRFSQFCERAVKEVFPVVRTVTSNT